MEKKRKICVLLVMVLCIGFVGIAIASMHIKKNEKRIVKSILEHASADTIEKGIFVALADDSPRVQLEYPSMTFLKKFDVIISYYPADAVYCKIISELGKTSLKKLNLKEGNLISYYFPDNLDNFITDKVSLTFYDENQRLLEVHEISVVYDRDAEQFEIFEIERQWLFWQ